MNSNPSKREAIKAYKARKPHRGIFAMRCQATGQTWVGSALNLDAARNGLWFGLRLGGQQDKSLQAAWNAHGEQAFSYEVLETLDEDVSVLIVRDILKEKKAHWSVQCGAPALL